MRRWTLGILLGVPLLVVVVCLAASGFVEQRYAGRIVREASAPTAPVAVVFGAGLGPNGEPSPVLAARLDTAMALHRDGKVRKILLSGDGTDRHHDETRVMRHYALEAGFPADALVSDPAGLSTYDSCYRAKAVYRVDHALLVTQEFHLPRALFIANSLGIDAYGVAADEAHGGHSAYEVRELFSRAWAFAMVLLRPEPHQLGPPEPIE